MQPGRGCAAQPVSTSPRRVAAASVSKGPHFVAEIRGATPNRPSAFTASASGLNRVRIASESGYK